MILELFSRFFWSIQSSVIPLIMLIVIALTMRTILVFIGQQWVKTFAHTATIVMLPIITFVITKVISGNIALSLGLVGALSIVRFRNPVRSPFELSVYFASITMGIAASVSLFWLLFLAASLSTAAGVIIVLYYLSPKITGNAYFETSFSEGNHKSTLEVRATAPIENLYNHQSLMSASRQEKKYVYMLASNNFDAMKEIADTMNNEKLVTNVQLNR
ncbi:MAG: DUF4956 domain-containing protein [Alphaproteobacteria bacterium]|nr:DUF4956 domain-containing protein [Alphaproteobacteria bacterium]